MENYIPRHAKYKINCDLWMKEFNYEQLQMLKIALMREIEFQKEQTGYIKEALSLLYKIETIIEQMNKN